MSGAEGERTAAQAAPPAARSRRKSRWHPVQVAAHIGAWIPLIVLAVEYQREALSVNPIQDLTHRTGNTALILLALSLACTPVYRLFRYAPALKLSRPLGLYGWMYAALHFLIFVGLDYGFDLGLILAEITEKRYIIVGFTAFVLLTVLAVTSFRWWMVKLGKNWKRLHRLVYLVNLLIVLHFAWAIKGDIFQLQGDVYRPLLAGLVVAALLALRFSAVRRWLRKTR